MAVMKLITLSGSVDILSITLITGTIYKMARVQRNMPPLAEPDDRGVKGVGGGGVEGEKNGEGRGKTRSANSAVLNEYLPFSLLPLCLSHIFPRLAQDEWDPLMSDISRATVSKVNMGLECRDVAWRTSAMI